MKYMLVMTEPVAELEKRNDPEQASAYWGSWNDYISALAKSGVMLRGDGLQLPHTATTVRVRDGKRVVQDGPFADTKEQFGGYFVIDVPDLDTALDWAAKSPAARCGAVEVRPVLVMKE
jgi:hypothetical protein